MPKAKKRKQTTFNPSPIKSAFLYSTLLDEDKSYQFAFLPDLEGTANLSKAQRLEVIQRTYTRLVNKCVDFLVEQECISRQLIMNTPRESVVAKLGKECDERGINTAYSQNAFKQAFTMLSTRFNNIRLEMLSFRPSPFVRSKVLFAMAVDHKAKDEMIAEMNALSLAKASKNGDIAGTDDANGFYSKQASELESMSDDDFSLAMLQFWDDYATTSLMFRIPHPKRASVPLDERIARIEPANHIKSDYVIYISDIKVCNDRICVPLKTSRHAIQQLKENTPANAFSYTIRNHNRVRVSWAYTKAVQQPTTIEEKILGVDTGIRDCLYVSNGSHYGSFSSVEDFYFNTVEPAFGDLSKIRAKKEHIKHFLHTHKNLPKDVRRSCIEKIDYLEAVLQKAKAPYHKKNHYRQMLEHEIAATVKAYVDAIDSKTLTVLEKLDTKEFDKSRKANGRLSTFARGFLQKRLMEQLNWAGYDFLEVEPCYTSQVCPKCFYLDKENRKEKVFQCKCCGFKDDADHVGSINICDRAKDDALMDICNKYGYNHNIVKGKLSEYYAKKHEEYLKAASF